MGFFIGCADHLPPSCRGLCRPGFPVRLRLVISTLWTACSVLPLRAQLLAVAPDSLPLHVARTMVITASRMPTAPDRAPAEVRTIERERLDLLQPESLAEALRQETGAGLTAYGGAGSLQLLSFRGMGPEYTAIYLNGMRLNDMQNGLVDAGRLPLASIDRIEAAPGGFSALYGSGAMGAVVNIVTLPSATLFRGSAGAGSFGWSRYDAQAGIAGSGGAASLALLSERATNDFSFTSPLDQSEKQVARANADFARMHLLFDGRLAAGESSFNASAGWSDSDVGVPGPYTGGAQGSARQTDREFRATAQWSRILGGASILRVGGSFFKTDERYTDPGIVTGGTPLDSRYRNDQGALSASIESRLSSRTRFAGGSELLFARLVSADVDGTPRRNQAAGFLSAEQILCGSDEDTARALRIFPALRYEFIHDPSRNRSYSILSPSIGFNYPLLPGILALRGKLDRNVRVPTFNQLYWAQGGNPELHPEYSFSAEAGFNASTAERTVEFEATFFHQDVRDKIVWMPGSGIFWSPKNIQHVLIDGLSARACWAIFPGTLRIEANGQWISARKENSSFAGDATAGKYLPYIPALSGNILLLATAGRFSISIAEELAGLRYTDEINTEANALPFHAVTSVAGRVVLTENPAEVILHLQVGNLFNQRYETVANYPMPLRWFRVLIAARYD